jgi:NYN domain-containing protein
MLTYTYVDNSNVFIEGQRVSAVAKGLAPNIYEAMNQRILDYDWNIDYGRLHELLCGDRGTVGCARLWGSPPPGDSFWAMVESKGWKNTVFDRNFAGKEKKVDVAIAHAITKDAYTILNKTTDELTLVAGDSDYVPVVRDLVALSTHPRCSRLEPYPGSTAAIGRE